MRAPTNGFSIPVGTGAPIGVITAAATIINNATKSTGVRYFPILSTTELASFDIKNIIRKNISIVTGIGTLSVRARTPISCVVAANLGIVEVVASINTIIR